MTPAQTIAAPGAGTAPQRAVENCRVLHLHSGNMYGGVETLLLTLASERNLCPSLEQRFGLCFEGRLSEEMRAAGVHPHILGPVRISRPWTMWQARRKLRRLLDQEPVDAVICHMPWPLAVFGPALRSNGGRVVFWAHNFHSGTGWLERLAGAHKPDVAVSASHCIGATVENIFPNVPVKVMPYPLPLKDASDEKNWRSEIRGELGVGEHTVVDVQFSRFEPWKGHLLHLQALAQLRDLPNWTAWFAGAPQSSAERKHFDTVRQTARELGIEDRVRFLGHRSDIPKLLAGADFHCQPNAGPEPFGIVFVEALWAGRPVVTTAMGGALEIVDQTCGILSEPGATQLAAALKDIIESAPLRRRLGQAGPARARQLCDAASQMRELAAIVCRAKATA